MDESHSDRDPLGPVSHTRPVGIIALTLLAWVDCALLITLAALLAISYWRDRKENPQDLSAYLGLTITDLSLLTLATISAVAGFDLFRFKKRGRSLAIVAMIFMGFFGLMAIVLEILDPGREAAITWLGASICLLSISSILYLHSANVRGKFTA